MVLAIGTYNKLTDPGIYLYGTAAAEHRFRSLASITGIENPSFLSTDNALGMIYAITEKKNDNKSALKIFQITDKGRQSVLISSITFDGAGSCNICTDSTKTHAFITNYGDGTITVIRLPQINTAGEVVQHLEFDGSGPDKERQDHSHPHAAILSKDEGYLYCTDLGADRLYRFAYHRGAKVPLQPADPLFIEFPAGSGPRHMALSPDGRQLYVITELSGEIFVFDAHELNKGWLQKVALPKPGFTGKAEAADIQINDAGSHLYASARGDANEIIVFSIEAVSGQLKYLQRISAGGLSPRSLLIDDRQGLLLAANEQSDNVSIFKLHSDGTLENSGVQIQVPSPTCLKAIHHCSQ